MVYHNYFASSCVCSFLSISVEKRLVIAVARLGATSKVKQLVNCQVYAFTSTNTDTNTETLYSGQYWNQ